MGIRNTEINRTPSGILKHKQSRIIMIILIALMVFLSSYYLFFAYNRYYNAASSEAIMLAQSLESLLHPEHISALSGSTADLEKPEYIMTKLSLERLVKTANPIRFAYLISERDGEIIFLIDSESVDSPDYSPPGQVYDEADDVTRESFRSDEIVLTEPATDRWGTWVSVLVPIKNSAGNIVAVLGLDYPADAWSGQIWNQMIPDGLIVVCVFMLFFALLYSRSQSSLLSELSKKLAMDEALYHSVFDQAPIGIAIVHDKNFVLESEFGKSNINPMFERILGRSSEQLEHIEWPKITHPDDLNLDLENFKQFKMGMIDGYSIEKRFIRPDGSSVWTHMKISGLLGSDNQQSDHHLCLLEDISARKETEQSLRESERSKSVFLSNLPGMAYRCKYDRAWTMQLVSDGCYALTGYKPENLLNNRDLSFNDLIAPEYRELLWDEWVRILTRRLPFRYEYEITTAEGARKWVLEMGQGVYNDRGEVEALEGIILDISASKEIENIFKYNSEHDIWTGLYNRRFLETLLREDATKRTPKNRAVVSINLSAIHTLSLKYNFQYSQELIKKTAKALDALSTESRQLFNTYENRFVFYVKAYRDKNELSAFCQSIVNILKAVLSVEKIGAGIGVVEFDEENKYDIDLLLKNLLVASEKAIYAYKSDIGICYFDKEMATQLLREETITYELSQIADGENVERLFLNFQPIFDLKSNQISGFEALARLNSDALGSISPIEFIPISEKSTLIVPLGYEIIRKAFRFQNRLRDNGYETIGVSINISAIQLLKDDFVQNLFGIINEMRVNPDNIALEITESIFVANHDEVNRILYELKSHGIKISLDDFGQGYSSLARERELNVNCLKIDKTFIDKLMFLKDEETITCDIISMGHKLGHCVIAEGVEYETQMKYLIAHNCDKIQGYLISRPIDEDSALELLKKQTDVFSAYQPISNESDKNPIAPFAVIEPYHSQLQLILDSTAEAIYEVDINGRCTFCNLTCLKLLGYVSREDFLGKNMHQLIHHSHRDNTPFNPDECKIYRAFIQGEGFESNDEVFWRADGTSFDVEYRSFPQMKDGKVVGAVVTFKDITDKKQREAELEYLSCHDMLTGLYNRRCLDERLSKIEIADNLPLSVIFADINGLKMTNDIFGHAAGDELIKTSAEIFVQSCRENDIIARVGGDEFIVLLPKTSRENTAKIVSRIRSEFSSTHIEAIKCSISMGNDTMTDAEQSLDETITNAENAMYREKTLNRKSTNKAVIDAIVEALHSKSPAERQHAVIVSELCGEVGAALHLPETEISKLKRTGYLHDIGKIVLDESIFSKDAYTEEELEKVRQHSAVGYRILNLFDDTLDLAEYVYGHHERWNGSGYPRGLKGEQIPLISRIISVVETYERGLNRRSLPPQDRKQAVLEFIREGSGTRFDPQIVEQFIRMIQEKEI